MSARHISLLAALSLIWGGSYLLIKYALDGFSAAMIVSARSLLASLVLLVVLRSRGRAGDDRRGVLLRALELRGEGPLRLAGRGADVVDLGHRRRPADAAGRDRDHARAHADPRLGGRPGGARRGRHGARFRRLLRAH